MISLFTAVTMLTMIVLTSPISRVWAAGEIKFSDDFSGTLSQWSYVDPNDDEKIYVDQGMLKVTTDAEFPQIKANITGFHNGTIAFKLKKFTVSDGNLRLYFRHVTDTNSTIFLIKTSGTTANLYSYTGSEAFSESHKIGQFDMSDGEYFDVKLVIKGLQLQVYVKEETAAGYDVVGTASGLSSGTGGVKLVGVNSASPAGSFHLDDFQIASLFMDDFSADLSQWNYVNPAHASKVFIDSGKLAFTTDSTFPQTDKWYLVQVAAEDEKIELYVNGRKKLAISNSTVLTGGKMGLFSSNADTYFDQIAAFR